ncbi:MAG: M28 family metallopeptidase [Armatimonadota bacterium]
MNRGDIIECLSRVSAEKIALRLLHLCYDPLPFRKLNCTLPGHGKCTLHEADDYITGCLRDCGYRVHTEGVRVQAYRCDRSKPKSRQYAPPEPSDPWFTGYNLYAKKEGAEVPDEIIVLCAHKDSQSWCDSPGAYDNAVGVAAVMGIARVLADVTTRRSVWFLFCNEEHTPWTSVTAAQRASECGHNIVAVFNTDSIGGKSRRDIEAKRMTNVSVYTGKEGRLLAELMTQVINDYDIALHQAMKKRNRPGDDDGSFIRAGFPAAIMNVGSYPYTNPDYHRESDTADKVDIENVYLAGKAILAAVLERDRS